jgi:hypothetical protein
VRAAATIYLLTALAVLAFVIFLLVRDGLGIGLAVLVLVACALGMLARGLIGGATSACRSAIVVSAFLAIGFALVPAYLYVQAGWAAVSHLWQFSGAFLALAIAHAMALVFLFRTKPSIGQT